MRGILLCLAGAAGALVLAEIVRDGHGAAVVTAPLVERAGKGDALAPAGPAGPEHTIATVEVIGVSPAAVVFRDSRGTVLFRTDPVRNMTVVVRGTTLPMVTLRDSSRAPAAPLVIDGPQPEEAPRAPAETLPDGCEPAASALSPVGSSVVGARCHAGLPGPALSLASLDNASPSR